MSKDSRKMSHIFNRCRQHQFYPVDLVDFAGTGIVVDGNDVGFRESLAQLLDHAFSYHMIRQACKRLCADDVRRTAVDQFYHLSGEEPALAGLIADGDERFGVGSQILNVCRFIKSFALCQFFS